MAAEDWFDDSDWGGYDDDDESRKELRCRHCGSTDVYWAESRGQWVLYDFTSRRHKCRQADLESVSEKNVSAFEDIA